jgi:hypothetical protein
MRWSVTVLLCLFFTVGIPLAEINSETFQHHYIAREMPGRNMGMGSPALADFDRDGDLDFAVLNRGDLALYWFENQGAESWKRHKVGQAEIGQLGSITHDIDGDGWVDIVIGGIWYRNPQRPSSEPFARHAYDNTIAREIHDMMLADVDGDGRADVVVMGDGDD